MVLRRSESSSPEQIHIAFGNDESEMTVSWASNDTEVAFVSYGIDKNELSMSKNGTTQTYNAGGWKGYLHHAMMSGLKPSTTYFYRVNDASEIFSFRTKPTKNSGKPVRIVAYGDMGTPGDVHGPGANYTVEFCESLDDLDFVLHVGDIPYDKGDEFVWDHFFRGVQGYASNVPYMVCPGNEDHAYDFVGYLSRFRMPGSKSVNSSWFYSYDYSFVHVISISTEYISREPGSEQYEFLENDLRSVNRTLYRSFLFFLPYHTYFFSLSTGTETPFVIMIGHRPLYCSSNDYYDCNMWAPRARETLEPLLSKYNVDLYICGHVHSYERTYPVLNGTRVSEVYENPNATTHVMVGGAGAGLSKTWSHDQPEWSASRIIDYAVGVIDVPNATTMHWKLVSTHTSGIDGEGEVLDEITITRN